MIKPSAFNVKAKLYIPTVSQKINGVSVKQYVEAIDFYCSAKSYGGTETTVNNKIAFEDTMTITTYYHPYFNGNCKIKLYDDNSEWEIITPPENIERRNVYCMFKVRRIYG